MIKIVLLGLLALLVVSLCVLLIWLAFQKPSHDKVWEMGQEALPHIIFDEDKVTIENLRDFAWTGSFEAEPNYITENYLLSELETVDVVISHFDDFEGLAHIFLSFGFSDARHVSISLEARRESHEEFSPFWGLLRQFEIIYVVGTDRDIVGLRTGHRDERVYIYPTIATPEAAQELFQRIAANINAIYDTPKFYNTLVHNCTNELTREVEAMSDYKFPLTYKTILPGFFDEILYDMKLIDASVPFDQAKHQARVDNSKVDAESSTYTTDVRAHLPARE